jgi:hypothetical protein
MPNEPSVSVLMKAGSVMMIKLSIPAAWRFTVRAFLLLLATMGTPAQLFGQVYAYTELYPSGATQGDGTIPVYAFASADAETYQPMYLTLTVKDPNNETIGFSSVTQSITASTDVTVYLSPETSPDGDYRAIGSVDQGGFHMGCVQSSMASQSYITHYDLSEIGTPDIYVPNPDSGGKKCAIQRVTCDLHPVALNITDVGLYFSFGPVPLACQGMYQRGWYGTAKGPNGTGALTGDCNLQG